MELAQLRYILPRLGEKETALSRLTGGIGGRGPGETKLEVNRRRIKERISFLEKRLIEVGKTRERKREKRRGTGIPVVSIVGYTNSGKSTLLNLFTKSTVEVQERFFSTLAPTTRLVKYPARKQIVLTDTVGFIEDLPEVLLRAFVATLEELEDATLLLHLVDLSSPDFEERIEIVNGMIEKLGLSEKKAAPRFQQGGSRRQEVRAVDRAPLRRNLDFLRHGRRHRDAFRGPRGNGGRGATRREQKSPPSFQGTGA